MNCKESSDDNRMQRKQDKNFFPRKLRTLMKFSIVWKFLENLGNAIIDKTREEIRKPFV